MTAGISRDQRRSINETVFNMKVLVGHAMAKGQDTVALPTDFLRNLTGVMDLLENVAPTGTCAGCAVCRWAGDVSLVGKACGRATAAALAGVVVRFCPGTMIL